MIHTQSQDNTPQILLTQGNLITEDPVHRSESGVLHKIEPGGPINKVIPGKSLFLKPISIIQRTPNRIFRHLHFYHRPRIIVIRRRHHNKCKSFSHQYTWGSNIAIEILETNIRCHSKPMFLKISQISQENSLFGVSFRPATLFKKDFTTPSLPKKNNNKKKQGFSSCETK